MTWPKLQREQEGDARRQAQAGLISRLSVQSLGTARSAIISELQNSSSSGPYRGARTPNIYPQQKLCRSSMRQNFSFKSGPWELAVHTAVSEPGCRQNPPGVLTNSQSWPFWVRVSRGEVQQSAFYNAHTAPHHSDTILPQRRSEKPTASLLFWQVETKLMSRCTFSEMFPSRKIHGNSLSTGRLHAPPAEGPVGEQPQKRSYLPVCWLPAQAQKMNFQGFHSGQVPGHHFSFYRHSILRSV